MSKAKEMTVAEFARLGGRGRARALTAQRRSEIARQGGFASARAKAALKRAQAQSDQSEQIQASIPSEHARA